MDTRAVARGLAKLDGITRAYPELQSPDARERLTKWIEREEEHWMGESKTIFARVPEEFLDALDRYLEKMRQAHPGLSFNRSDAIRELLHRALVDEGCWSSE